jgi:LysR family transcriptional activator of nhaA
MYNYNHLYYFYVTAKSGGVMLASKHLRVSQPSLSSQLKLLETSLGVKLFRRVGRKNELTEAGLAVYGYCRQMFDLAEEMRESLTTNVPFVSRRMQIGVSEEVDRSFVVEVVSLFMKKHGLAQRPKVTMVSDNDRRLIERLRFRELDAVVTEKVMVDPDLVNLEYAQVPVTLACSINWKVRRRPDGSKPSAIREILGRSENHWVMPSAKFKLRSEIDQFFEENRLAGRIVFESDVMASLVRSVIDEIGIAFVPLLYLAREVREASIQVLGPKGGYWKYRVWLVCHHQNQNDALIQSIARSFNEICEQAIR